MGGWSFSKLKNFEDCPLRHYSVEIKKSWKEDESDALLWGNQVHDAMKKALRGNTPLPGTMAPYQKWVDMVYTGPGELLVEQKYAITKEFEPCAWFAPTAWYRGIGDVVRIDEIVALILDWKTGAFRQNSLEKYGTQLFLMAQCVFSHYPAVQRVRSEFVWLQDDLNTTQVFSREDMTDEWMDLLPRVQAYEQACASNNFPPKPGGLCMKYCPVQTCPYWKKGTRG